MMKVHVCPICKYKALTSRRTECVCKACNEIMYRVDSVSIEDWWQMNEEKRNIAVEEFLAKKTLTKVIL